MRAKFLVSFLIFIFSFAVSAQISLLNHLTSVSQGISMPSSTSTLNYSTGFTMENPAGVVFQRKLRLTGLYDTGSKHRSSADGYGGELGFSNGTIGLAAGYYTRDCYGCEEEIRGALGMNNGFIALGLGFAEDLYSAGLIVNTYGTHRFAAMGSLNDAEGDNNNVTAFGIGYTYFAGKYSLSIDASKRDNENPNLSDKTIALSPGLAFYFRRVSFSLTYDAYLENESGLDEDLWFGLGFGTPGKWFFNVYHNYVNEWTFSGSMYF